MTGPTSCVLELRRLSRSFGETRAVDGVDACIAPGEFVCILGPSGCGKTTLLRLIAGFETPSSGEVLLDGQSLDGVPPERRDVNVVFQSYALFPHLDVTSNVGFGLRMKRRPASEMRERVAEALKLVRLDELAARRPHQLSGGQQQRVALARALVNRPRVLLLDEPLSALDRGLRLAMQHELRELQQRTGVTFIHITHDQGEAMSLADRLIVMRAGRFIQTGSASEVYHRPATRFVAEFVGSANLLEGAPPANGTVGVVTDGGLELRGVGAQAANANGRVVVSIRPEAVQLLPPDAPEQPNTFTGRVRSLAFAGATIECVIDAGSHILTVHLPGRAAAGELAEGQNVLLCVQPADVVVLPPESQATP